MFIFGMIMFLTVSSAIEEAQTEYSQGETAKTIVERQEAFNRTLTAYGKLEEEYQPLFGNGKLYYNLGNAYYQLEQYPMAIYDYTLAESLRPRDSNVAQNLKSAQLKLGLSQEPPPSIFSVIFFPYTYLSLPERLQITFLLGLVVFLLASLFIWVRHRFLRRALILFAIFWGLMLMTVLYDRYFAPIDGVIMRASELYRDSNEQSAKAMDEPILSGTKVRVLDVVENGKWLKILMPSGEIGYLPYTHIKLLR